MTMPVTIITKLTYWGHIILPVVFTRLLGYISMSPTFLATWCRNKQHGFIHHNETHLSFIFNSAQARLTGKKKKQYWDTFCCCHSSSRRFCSHRLLRVSEFHRGLRQLLYSKQRQWTRWSEDNVLLRANRCFSWRLHNSTQKVCRVQMDVIPKPHSTAPV